MGAPRQAKKKRRFRPAPPPPRWRLPVHRRPFWAGIAVGLGVSAALLVLVFAGRPSSPSANAPWGANRTHLRERLRALGLPALPVEGRALHTHEHVDLYLNGTHVAVPAGIGIGIDPSRRFFSPLHTHDRTGILHVESPTRTAYTLGQFFGVWGVRLSAKCIGSYCAGGGRTLQAFVAGRPVNGDPTVIPLRRHAEIVLAYGTRPDLPKRIPSSYSFPAGD
ncbi:MAG: hypothetical protein E6G09_11195 [Actinobacteria bacterium]|nr:MAG: hypothetical protein E6G09_11195 [Actinomycetota bacterium]